MISSQQPIASPSRVGLTRRATAWLRGAAARAVAGVRETVARLFRRGGGGDVATTTRSKREERQRRKALRRAASGGRRPERTIRKAA